MKAVKKMCGRNHWNMPVCLFFCVDYKAKTWSFSGMNLFSKLSVDSNGVENCVQYVKRPVKESWEAETFIENRKAANPLVISLEEVSEGENDSDD
jgi:hypothetical protein